MTRVQTETDQVENKAEYLRLVLLKYFTAAVPVLSGGERRLRPDSEGYILPQQAHRMPALGKEGQMTVRCCQLPAPVKVLKVVSPLSWIEEKLPVCLLVDV